MASSARNWTVDEVRALPDDGNRYEVVDGELLVTPAPSFVHQATVLELAVALREYVALHQLGTAVIAPADVAFGPRVMLQPDVFVASTSATALPRDWSELGPLLLAVEVLSPSTARQDPSPSASSISGRPCRSTGSRISTRGSSNVGGPTTSGPKYSAIASNGSRPTGSHRSSSS